MPPPRPQSFRYYSFPGTREGIATTPRKAFRAPQRNSFKLLSFTNLHRERVTFRSVLANPSSQVDGGYLEIILASQSKARAAFLFHIPTGSSILDLLHLARILFSWSLLNSRHLSGETVLFLTNAYSLRLLPSPPLNHSPFPFHMRVFLPHHLLLPLQPFFRLLLLLCPLLPPLRLLSILLQLLPISILILLLLLLLRLILQPHRLTFHLNLLRYSS